MGVGIHMKELIFKIIDNETQHVYEIYDDGSTSGFPDNCVIFNRHTPIIRSLTAKLSIESKNKQYIHL